MDMNNLKIIVIEKNGEILPPTEGVISDNSWTEEGLVQDNQKIENGKYAKIE